MMSPTNNNIIPYTLATSPLHTTSACSLSSRIVEADFFKVDCQCGVRLDDLHQLHSHYETCQVRNCSSYSIAAAAAAATDSIETIGLDIKR